MDYIFLLKKLYAYRTSDVTDILKMAHDNRGNKNCPALSYQDITKVNFMYD